MPLIQVPNSVMPCQVEVPDSVENRSKPGSIHFKPGMKRLTPEEWEHVKKTDPALANQCHVVPIDETKTKGAIKAAAEAKKAAASAPKPVLDKRAKDHLTKRQRKLADMAEGDKKASAKSKATPKPEPDTKPEAKSDKKKSGK